MNRVRGGGSSGMNTADRSGRITGIPQLGLSQGDLSGVMRPNFPAAYLDSNRPQQEIVGGSVKIGNDRKRSVT